MSIKHVILGWLSEMSMTGYDLKKKFSDSDIFHWSGNNNQIYKTLSELHQEELVTIEVQQQDNKPPRKIYTITEAGLAELRSWMLSTPELPQFRSPLLMQLSWAEQLAPHEVGKLLAQYEEDLETQLVILREKMRRNAGAAGRSLKARVAEHWLSFYEHELAWARGLREELGN